MNTASRHIPAAASALALALPAAAQHGDAGAITADRITPLSKPAPYSPYAGRTFPPALISAPGTAIYRSTWEEIIAAAEEANEPGAFTAFIG